MRAIQNKNRNGWKKVKKLRIILTLAIASLLAVAFVSCKKDNDTTPCSHKWDGGAVVTQATCTQEGVAKYGCTLCSETKEVAIGAKGHDYAEAVVTPASCTEDGAETYTCKVCSDIKTVVIPAKEHSFSAASIVTPASCSANGLEKYTCSACSATKEVVIPATEHEYVLNGAPTPASCTVDGAENYACKNCSAKKTVPVPAKGHVYSETTTVIPASCTENGTETFTCSVCEVTATIPVPAKGHDYAKTVISEASCTQDGVAKNVCKACNDTHETFIPANGHSFYNKTVVPASCYEEGYAEKVCEKCSAEETEVLEKTGHSLVNEERIEPTCSVEGSVTATCELCSEVVLVEVLPVTDHSFKIVNTLASYSATCSKPGLRVFNCRTCSETSSVETAPTGRHSYTSHYYIKTKPTANSDGEKVACCKACTAEKSVAYTLAEYQADLATAIEKLSSVDLTAFGTNPITEMDTTKYATPTAYPTAGEHPRVLINPTTLEQVRAAIQLDENINWFNSIIEYANKYDSGLLGEMVVYSSSSANGPKGEHNLNEAIYDCVMSKSLLYLLTGVETYAHDAVRIMMEYISTMKIKTVSPDPERTWGYAMFAAAVVYDWCYYAMDEETRIDFIRGVECCVAKTSNFETGTAKSNMEIGFPPVQQGAVGSHGSERQLLRDYLSAAIAFYDEAPSWYELIAGRFYEQYVPVRNEFYEAEMYPQGISVYVQIRYTADLWSAWLMKAATGTVPYSAQMEEVVPSLFCRIVDGGYTVFDEGDDEGKSDEEIVNGLSFAASISAYLFNDTRAASWASHLGYRYSSGIYMIILRSTGVDESKDRFEDLELIRYNAGFIGEVIAHSDWTENAASVLMKIGGRSTANHDHADAGSFQIYYKDILAGDTGFYDSYGTTHHRDYHQATVAHNSILIYRNGTSIGQTPLVQEPGTLDGWMHEQYHVATVTGQSSAYKDAEETQPIYAYIAGDLTPSYAGNFTKADRRMLAVFDTDNPDAPLYFFVYDSMASVNKSDDIAFLLHTKSEPLIDGNTVTTVTGGAKLVLQSLMGGDKFEKLGGDDQNYILNGEQLPTQNGEDDGYWGRVEIKSTSTKDVDTLLNVMYVTDSTNEEFYEAYSFSTDKVVGSVLGNTAAVFYDSDERCTTEFTFTAATHGESINYYVSGIAAGDWTVTVGETTLTVTATEEGGMLYFTAPAAEVTITPAN